MSSPSRKRLDELLPEKNLVESRSMARALILAGRVFVDGTRVDKAGTLIDPDLPIASVEAAATIMAKHEGWDRGRAAREIDAYVKYAARFRLR